MSGEPLSLQDILQQRRATRPDIVEVKRQQELAESGCVVRAIDSATGRQSSPTECYFRLNQMANNPTMADILEQAIIPGSSPEQVADTAKSLIRKGLQVDLENVRQFASAAATQSGHKVVERRLTPAQIRKAIRLGDSVAVTGASHTAHVVEHDGSLVSKSDEGTPRIKLDEGQEYTTFTFRKRGE